MIALAKPPQTERSRHWDQSLDQICLLVRTVEGTGDKCYAGIGFAKIQSAAEFAAELRTALADRDISSSIAYHAESRQLKLITKAGSIIELSVIPEQTP